MSYPAPLRRPTRAALTVLAVAAAASGCGAQVSTDVVVTSANQAHVSVAAVFTGEAADAIMGSDATKAQLLGVFSDRASSKPEYSADAAAHRVEVTQHLTYDELHAAGSLLGVTDAQLSGSSAQATLKLTVAPPTRLTDAVTAGNKAQPDAAALTSTMLKSTDLVVSVTFPGGVTSYTLPNSASSAGQGDTVVYTRAADSTEKGMFVVSGDPKSARWPYVAGAFGVALGAVFLVWRRRRG